MPWDESVFQDMPLAEPDEQLAKTLKLTPNTLLGAAKDAMAGPAHSAEPQRKKRKQPKKKPSSTSTSQATTTKEVLNIPNISPIRIGSKGSSMAGLSSQ